MRPAPDGPDDTPSWTDRALWCTALLLAIAWIGVCIWGLLLAVIVLGAM